MSIGLVLVATVVLTITSPVAIPVLAAIDLVTRGSAWRTRTWLLVLAVLYTELAGVALATVVTIVHLGRLDRPAARRRFHRLEHWWAGIHADNLRRFAGLRWVVENPDELGRGPAIVLARHASHADAVLPVLLYGCGAGLALRYTLKDDLQWAPAMDIVGNRLPNVFVDRDPGPDSPMVARLEALAALVDDDSVAVIFPEGTFYTPERLDRAATRIAESRPELEDTVRGLRHLLPPRPTGTLALLRGAPTADLVVIAHEGMEGFGGGAIADIARNVPLRGPVRVRVWRIPRARVPGHDDEFIGWLLSLWVEIDEWIERCRIERARGDAVPAGIAGLPELTW